MFEYVLPQPSFWSLWSSNPLLKSIQIQGPFITLYGRKTVGEELHFVLGELKGRVIQGDDLEHGTIHGQVDLPFGWNIEKPHVHYTMPEKSVEQGITALITAIFKREVPAEREKDYNDFLAEAERSRIEAGDTELPEFMKKSMAQYDTKSPFFLSQNCQELLQDILSKYREYCTNPNNERCCELIQMYRFAIIKPLAYTRYSADEAPNSQLQSLGNLLRPLGDIKKCIENLQKEPSNTETLNQIQQLILKVNVDELVKLESPESKYLIEGTTLRERLNFVSKFIQKSLEDIEKMKKIHPTFAFPSLNRVSQIFYTMVRNPFLKYGFLSLSAIIVFKNCMKLNYAKNLTR